MHRVSKGLLCCLVGLTGCASVAEERPAHHTENGFRNLYIEQIDKGPIGFVKAKYFSDEVFADHESEASRMQVADVDYQTLLTPPEKPQVTWLGHSTFLIQYKGVNILTDPMLTNRASPISFAGPKRLVPKPIGFEHLPKIDFVVISHNHYDHLDKDSINTLGNEPRYLVPLKVDEWFADQDVELAQVQAFDWWDRIEVGDVEFVATPSQHWSARGLFDRYETLWAAWYIRIADFELWFGGDTGYNDIQFKEVGERWPTIDLGLIPIGAYAPRWFMKMQHVDPDDALLVHKDIGAKKSIGMHWGTFELSAEPMFEPEQRVRAFEKEGLTKPGEFVTLAIGETVLIEP